MNKTIMAMICAALPSIGLTCTLPDLQLNMLGKTSDAVTCKYKLIGNKNSVTGSICAYRFENESRMYQGSKSNYSDGSYTVTKCKKQIGSDGLFIDDRTCIGKEKFSVQFKHIGQSIAVSGKTTTGFFDRSHNVKTILDCKDVDIDVSLLRRYMNHVSILNGKPIAIKLIDKERREVKITHIPDLQEEIVSFEDMQKLKHLDILNLHPIHGDDSLKVTDKLLNQIANKKFTCFKESLYKEGMVSSKKMGSLQIKKTKSHISVKFTEGLEKRAYASTLSLENDKLTLANGRIQSKFRVMTDSDFTKDTFFIDLGDLRCFAGKL